MRGGDTAAKVCRIKHEVTGEKLLHPQDRHVMWKEVYDDCKNSEA